MITFSIIIPTYNRADFIQASIESVLLQTYQNFEIIVVDDASTDNTKEVVKNIKSEKIIYIKKNINTERASARNTGTNAASGQYVYFHDSDDILYPNHLEEAAKLIKTKPKTVFFALGYELINQNSIPKHDSFSTKMGKIGTWNGDLNRFLIKGNFLSAKVFLLKSLALQYPFCETRALSGSEDYELWLRLAARHPIDYTNIISSAIILHHDRSVQNEQPAKLIERISLLENNVANDKAAVEAYQKDYSNFLSDNRSYISLHLAMSHHKILAINYLLQSFLKSPLRLLSTKRFYAIVRILVFG